MTNQQLTLSWAAKAKDYPLPESYNGAGIASEPNCADRLEIRLRVNEIGVIEAAGRNLPARRCGPAPYMPAPGARACPRWRR